MAGRGFPCPRCGGTERVQMSETDSRCADCGLGATSARLSAGGPSRSPAQRRQDDEDQFELLELMRRTRPRTMTDLPFSAFALDERWGGLRSIAGSGGGGGGTDRMTLGHGVTFDEYDVWIRVETRLAPMVGLRGPRNPLLGRYSAVQDLVRELWVRAETMPAAVRAAAFPYPERTGDNSDPTAPWVNVTIPVDGVATDAKVLDVPEHDLWLGFVEHGEVFIGIVARRWPLAQTGLVSVSDFDIYMEGSLELAILLRRRAYGT